MKKESKRNVVLVLCVMMAMVLVGCGKEVAVTPELSDSEVVSETVLEPVSEEPSEEVSEVVSEEISEEMTVEELIVFKIPQKLEVGEDEIIVPETVTAEQILTRWEEVKKTSGHYHEDTVKEYLAGLLTLNCLYMDSAEFTALVNEYFDDPVLSNIECLEYYYSWYIDHAFMPDYSYVPKPSELLFDDYLINQAEQAECLIQVYNELKAKTETPAPVDEYLATKEDLKVCLDIIVDYCFRDENKYMTFDCYDERIEGSGTGWISKALFSTIRADYEEYAPDYVGVFDLSQLIDLGVYDYKRYTEEQYEK